MIPRIRVPLMMVLLSVSACAHLPRMESAGNALSPTEHITLGDAYLTHNERKSAHEQYQMALEGDRRSVPALVALGNMAFEDHDLKNARKFFHRAWKVNPQNAAIINNLAMVDVEERVHLQEAKAQLEKALPTAGPAAPYLLDTLATIAIQEGRLADAREALGKAAAAAPANDPDFPKHLRETQDKLPKTPANTDTF